MKGNKTENIIEITDIRELTIYKVCELYPGLSWSDVLEITSKILNAWGFGDLIPAKVDRENLRKVLEKMEKSKVVVKTLTKLYATNKEIKVRIPEPLRIWENRFHSFLTTKQIRGEEILRIQREHTEKLKERIIRPWIVLLREGSAKEVTKVTIADKEKYKPRTMNEIKRDPLFKDLSNHIPSNLENPVLVLEELEKEEDRKNEYEKSLKKELEEIIKGNLKNLNQKIAETDELYNIIGTGLGSTLNFRSAV